MEKIVLKGGDVHYTTEDRSVYRVVKGTVLVYIVPFRKGEEGRRLLLGEFGDGSRIPGFHHRSELMGEWEFGLVAMDMAGLIKEDAAADDGMLMAFADAAGLKIPDVRVFDDFVIEEK